MKRPTRTLSEFPFLTHNYTFWHPHLREGVQNLKVSLSTLGMDEFVVIIGPTGAGKSHIGEQFVRAILEEAATDMKADLQYLPGVLVRVRLLTPQGKFNWTHFYTVLLKALKHPNPTFKDLGEAREKLDAVLRSRRVRYLVLDEADHFLMDFKADDADAVRKQANVLKSLVQNSETKLVLIGTYDVAPLVDTNGQLSRRNLVVHLPRYRNTVHDRERFSQALADMDREFQGLFSFSLQKHSDDIYRGCVGLLGVAARWFARAARIAEKKGDKAISLEVLQHPSIKLSVKALNRILDDAENGEAAFDDDGDSIANFNKRTAAPARESSRDERGKAAG